jgi:hypothetical protein
MAGEATGADGSYTIEDYKRDVINLFRGGHANEEQWRALGAILNNVFEDAEYDPGELIGPIDDELLGKRIKCRLCGSLSRPKLPCWGCGEAMIPSPPARSD